MPLTAHRGRAYPWTEGAATPGTHDAENAHLKRGCSLNLEGAVEAVGATVHGDAWGPPPIEADLALRISQLRDPHCDGHAMRTGEFADETPRRAPSIAALAALFTLCACSHTITGSAVDGGPDASRDVLDAALADASDVPNADASDAPDGDDALTPPRTASSPGRRLVVMVDRTFVLNANGEWYGWGNGMNQSFGADAPSPVTQITRLDLDERNYTHWIGYIATCRVERTGLRRVQCWGSNGRAELGIGPPSGPVLSPQTVPRLDGVRYVFPGGHFASTDAGVFFWMGNIVRNEPEMFWPRLIRTTPLCAMSFETTGLGYGYDCETRSMVTWSLQGAGTEIVPVEMSRRLDDVAMLHSLYDSFIAVRHDGSVWCRGDCVRSPGRPEQGGRTKSA